MKTICTKMLLALALVISMATTQATVTGTANCKTTECSQFINGWNCSYNKSAKTMHCTYESSAANYPDWVLTKQCPNEIFSLEQDGQGGSRGWGWHLECK